MKPALKMDTNLTYPEAIIFDWDNTLVDSHEIIATAMTKMHAAFDLPPVTVEQAKNAPQRALKEVFQRNSACAGKRPGKSMINTLRDPPGNA